MVTPLDGVVSVWLLYRSGWVCVSLAPSLGGDVSSSVTTFPTRRSPLPLVVLGDAYEWAAAFAAALLSPPWDAKRAANIGSSAGF